MKTFALAIIALALAACSNGPAAPTGAVFSANCYFTGTPAQELFNNGGTISANGGTGVAVTSYMVYQNQGCVPGYTLK